ncbi:methionine--tRNA ligase [Candidatus Cryosericum hinesii]|jgi:methionyl-tRNA synthetase|uniref:Methionine--tRNA ligase n=1 Tax=Candidatus Cryosericum hinesii TaxID=2290915 RepID=A0A398DE81_9BACT|nr:methionine--tRNA ligase [Candidatus Cryosericum hinesii]RIE13785.1 methionine--tRNA ligase [Candidatus Cryosericum hinesii]RIE13802.1 methionine--tRNA ligase [Candidatus Cryosericum hinesii]
MDRYFLTTAIYYINDKPHLGSVSETIAADFIARYQRKLGKQVLFSTGTDEHSQKVERTALAMGQPVEQYTATAAASWKALFDRLGISYSRFIRTTDADHMKVVQEMFQKLYDQGDIYKGSYDGWYCIRDEAFLLESDLVEGKCPHCGLEVQHVSEVNYFFRLSKYQDTLLAWYEQHPDFVQPPMRYNELVNVIKGGLHDVSVSRSTVKWGVPVPFDTEQTVYVWFDALINYATVAGYGTERFVTDWPADLHLIGKDITRFHGIIWPAMLMALNLPLPRRIFAHGFWNFEGEKMSKSLGNVVDPAALIENLSHLIGIDEPMAVDALRYYLCREGTYGLDVDFSSQRLLLRFNTDLANDLGNLLNRTLNMFAKFRPQIEGQPLEPKSALSQLFSTTLSTVSADYSNLQFSAGLEKTWMLVNVLNKMIEDDKPWALAKVGDAAGLATHLATLLTGLWYVANLVEPCMPTVSDRLLEAIRRPQVVWSDLAWRGPGSELPEASSTVLFPRIQPDQLEEFLAAQTARKTGTTTGATATPPPVAVVDSGLITIDDVAKVQLRIATILEGERVPETDKLVKLRVKVGDEERTIVAGIGKHYDPAALVGKQIVIVANLQPRKLKGIASQGMLLAASAGDEMALLTPMTVLPDGAEIH